MVSTALALREGKAAQVDHRLHPTLSQAAHCRPERSIKWRPTNLISRLSQTLWAHSKINFLERSSKPIHNLLLHVPIRPQMNWLWAEAYKDVMIFCKKTFCCLFYVHTACIVFPENMLIQKVLAERNKNCIGLFVGRPNLGSNRSTLLLTMTTLHAWS